MQSKALTVADYLAELPEDRREVMDKLRQAILKTLPEGFTEVMSYGMIGYVVPHTLYPAGYHCDPKLPLPFMGLAAQKNNYSLYHMGVYADPELLDWFTKSYNQECKTKLDMGKSCIRFKKAENIPWKLIEALSAKLTPAQWIALYESAFKK